MSSTGLYLSHREARVVAEMIVERLERYCVKIEIAGSIRRLSPVCHDVELVVIPARTTQGALFDDATPPEPKRRSKKDEGPVDDLDNELHWMLANGDVKKREDGRGRTFWGPSDKRLLWKMASPPVGNMPLGEIWVPVDIFGALPSTWGAKLALRTGPWRFSKRLVTPIGKGGLLAHNLEFRQGGLYHYPDPARSAVRRFIPTPDEESLFFALGLPYIEPERRDDDLFRNPSERVR